MSDVWTIERHLEAGSDHGRALFHRLVDIVAACGEYTTSVAKTTITFKGPRRGFAGARPVGDRLVGYFDVTYRVDDARIRSVAPYQKDLFVHHYRVDSLRADGRRVRRLDCRRVRPGRVRQPMKLVTFDDGKVGGRWREDGRARRALAARVVRARRGRRPSGACARRRDAPRADRPEEVLSHRRQLSRARGGVEAVGWSHEIAPWIVFFQNVDAIVGPEEPVVHPQHLTERAGLRARAGRRDPQAGEMVLARGRGRVHRRLHDLQRHHRARHPAARDAERRLLVLQGDRHVLPARAVDRDAGRDPGPARSRMELRVNGEPRQTSHSGRMSVTIPEILATTRRSATRRGTSSRPAPSGRRGILGGRGVALPQARQRDRGRDRAHRRPPEPGRRLGGGPRRAPAAEGALVTAFREASRSSRRRRRLRGRRLPLAFGSSRRTARERRHDRVCLPAPGAARGIARTCVKRRSAYGVALHRRRRRGGRAAPRGRRGRAAAADRSAVGRAHVHVPRAERHRPPHRREALGVSRRPVAALAHAGARVCAGFVTASRSRQTSL